MTTLENHDAKINDELIACPEANCEPLAEELNDSPVAESENLTECAIDETVEETPEEPVKKVRAKKEPKPTTGGTAGLVLGIAGLILPALGLSAIMITGVLAFIFSFSTGRHRRNHPGHTLPAHVRNRRNSSCSYPRRTVRYRFLGIRSGKEEAYRHPRTCVLDNRDCNFDSHYGNLGRVHYNQPNTPGSRSDHRYRSNSRNYNSGDPIYYLWLALARNIIRSRLKIFGN